MKPVASVEALRDPETCKGCHAEHYAEWQGSMHAYAATDPVFIAMNERGQKETGGQLGDFCVKCHAPMALELGLTTDGLNLPDLTDPSARGVTCYFCHDVSAVEGDHNRALVLAHDATMRGGLGAGKGAADARNAAAAAANAAHRSTYSPLHDGSSRDSAALCGACHD
ncbi:MAG: multiheme c-type cytochrome, partial [Polyangiales bacterium]